jgi:hypothetical protein
MQARERLPDSAVMLDWSSAAGEMTLGTTDGTLTFAVTADAVNALTTDNRPHAWVYDLFLTSSGGVSRKACMGTITIVPRATRP